MGAWRAAALAAQFGFSVVGSLVGGVVIGRFLDQQFGTHPLFFLLGLLGGLVSSIYLIYLIYRVQVQPQRPAYEPPTPRQACSDRRPMCGQRQSGVAVCLCSSTERLDDAAT